ncbi:MAG: hypothetical protein IPM16_15370 [Chloroflexi bacterium]|nr:hypothetical protein [Chloroflexota bacterium]
MNLKQVYASLSAAYQFWSPHTINQNFVVRQFGDFVELTWNQRSSELISEIPTEDALAEMVNRRQFSFQFEGGAAVRVHYRFDRRGKEIVSASLGYFSLIDTREEVDTPTWPSSDRGVELQDSSGKLRQISIEAAYDAESPHNSTTVRDGNTRAYFNNTGRWRQQAAVAG